MEKQKISGLFINCVEASDSIFESGMMAYRCLLGSDKFSLDYFEITPDNISIPAHHDFYLFNYHFATMAWLDPRSIRQLLPGVRMTLVLEVSPNDPFVLCAPDLFDVYCVLDPTLKPDRGGVFAFPRPLESDIHHFPFKDTDIPVIGSFGFATPGKGFEHVVDAVSREFERAIVKINIPHSDYVPHSREAAARMAEMCKRRARTGIEVVVTHDFMSKEALIDWCAQNTLNCFLYDRNMAGLAATTDQAIASGRPLITSKNNTFRHITSYIKPFPYQSLKEAIEHTQPIVARIQDDWSARRFRECFENLLHSISIKPRRQDPAEMIKLLMKPIPSGPIYWLRSKIAVRTRLRKLKSRLPEFKKKPAVDSFSQFGEDIIINDLFNELAINSISYLDIGANNPKFISNTYLFYERGFNGVLVEPNSRLCKKLAAERPRDRVLNVGIGVDDSVKEADFYLFPEEADGLSTFSESEAKFWETTKLGGRNYQAQEVVKVPLMNVNEVIANYFTEYPDIVSIDVEGWDLKILETFDFEKYSPAVFCVETLAYNDDGSTYRNNAVEQFLDKKGYFAYKETYANTIFVNRNLYDFYLFQKGVNGTLDKMIEHDRVDAS